MKPSWETLLIVFSKSFFLGLAVAGCGEDKAIYSQLAAPTRLSRYWSMELNYHKFLTIYIDKRSYKRCQRLSLNPYFPFALSN